MPTIAKHALATLLVATPLLALADTTAGLDEEAGALIQTFASSLKAELVEAMSAGGPSHAIGVCQERAPAIAATLSEDSEWNIARTSLKPRNPENAPDAWETDVLEQFESRKAAGNEVAGMHYAEVVERNGQAAYRFMQAIPTEGVCLTCHGTHLDPALAQTIDDAYPEDQARGYSVGDIRGAFTLSQPLQD